MTNGTPERIHALSISTHTLTWSVTISVGGVDYGMGISTHTLTWSVTEKLTQCANRK
mgnify:FL=1